MYCLSLYDFEYTTKRHVSSTCLLITYTGALSAFGLKLPRNLLEISRIFKAKVVRKASLLNMHLNLKNCVEEYGIANQHKIIWMDYIGYPTYSAETWSIIEANLKRVEAFHTTLV